MSSNDKDELGFVRGLASTAHALRETRSLSRPSLRSLPIPVGFVPLLNVREGEG